MNPINKLRFIFISLRPNAWARIAGEMLLGATLVPHAFSHFSSLLAGFLILAPGVAGASYILNDITDKKYDMSHPLRWSRPIANSNLSVFAAAGVVGILIVISFVVSFFISLPLFLCCIVLFLSEILYTMPPIRLKEVFFFDIFLNSINSLARFTTGFFLSGGITTAFPVIFALFAVVVKVILFIGHRWQNRNQEKHFNFKSTVVFVSKTQVLLIFLLLGILAAIAYVISIFHYRLPIITLLYPVIVGILLLPIARSILQEEKRETMRNYLYLVFFLFTLLLFITVQIKIWS